MISVIVPVYNGAHVLAESVPAMLAQKVPAQWLFVDDGSTDDTAERLAELTASGPAAGGATVEVLRHDVNRGRAAARNTGLDAATGELVAFLDADVAPAPGYLDALSRTLAQPGVIAAVGRLQFASDPADPYHRYLASPLRGPSRHAPGEPLPWRFFLTCVAAVRAEAARAVGGFDESITYGEDLDVAARLSRRAPEGLRYAPDAVGRMHDLGDLTTALAKLREFGRDNLPAMIARYPELARQTGVDVVHSAAGARGLAARLLLRPRLAGLVRRVLPGLPGVLSDYAVRYLLGYTLAVSYREGLQA